MRPSYWKGVQDLMSAPAKFSGSRRSPARRTVAGSIVAILLVGTMATACSSDAHRVGAAGEQKAPAGGASTPAPSTTPSTPAPRTRSKRASRTSLPAPSTTLRPTTTLPPTTVPPTTLPPTTLRPTTTLPPTTLPASTTLPPTTMPPATTTTTAAPEAEQPGWTPVGLVGGAIAVDERTVETSGGAEVTVFRFRAGRVRFDLHVGSQDPPADLAALPADAQPAVSSTEAPVLLAGFNGGFQVDTGTGGVEVDGQVLVPLQTGAATFAIDADGTGHVGVWGQDLPAAGEQVTSVRQNLPPLVLNAQPSPQISDVAAWGATLGGGSSVARSALGEDAAGNILYAGSMSALPSDMAEALISSGATTAMELDINPEWVQLAYATTPGGPLQAGIPGQNRPSDQYTVGWTRDFVTVLAAP